MSEQELDAAKKTPSTMLDIIAEKNFLKKIDLITKNLASLAMQDLTMIVQSEDMEDIIPNVINNFIWQSKDGEINSGVLKKVYFLAKQRMDYLKSKFPKNGASREIPEKMEYDTIIENLKNLKNILSKRV